ncbi:hypothetical protein ACSBR2_031181 [Camellia fascicularis]
MAVQKANGLWCDDRALKVKMAEFGKDYEPKHKSVQIPQLRMHKENNHMSNVAYQRKRSFAEMVKGSGAAPAEIITIKAYKAVVCCLSSRWFLTNLGVLANDRMDFLVPT